MEGEDYLVWMYKITSLEPERDGSYFEARSKPHAVYWKRPGFTQNAAANLTLVTMGVRNSAVDDLYAFHRSIEEETNPVFGTLMINVGKRQMRKLAVIATLL